VNAAKRLRRVRVRALERAFGVTLTETDAAACDTRESAARLLRERLGSADAPGESLDALARMAVDEAIRRVVRNAPEPIRDGVPLTTSAPELFRKPGRWDELGEELGVALPPLRAAPAIQRLSWWCGYAVPAALLAAFLHSGTNVFRTDPWLLFALFVPGVSRRVASGGRPPLPAGVLGPDGIAEFVVASRGGRLLPRDLLTANQVEQVVSAIFRVTDLGHRPATEYELVWPLAWPDAVELTGDVVQLGLCVAVVVVAFFG
jgi:hypothetical protein